MALPGHRRRLSRRAAPPASCKSAWYGSNLVVDERWYPSSKACSRCKAAKAELSLAERTYCCQHCGLVIDRDRNAARNLASFERGERSMGSLRCSRANWEDGTGLPARIVTVTRQRVARKPVLVRSDR
ncbi:MAG: zinc ribbon domain-containing protein [Acidimicrobiales bacterium]